MEIIIKINVDNAIFEETGGTEVARILRELATKYDGGGVYVFTRLRDLNGNVVGSVAVED